jgi:phage terminase large subunit-like protein
MSSRRNGKPARASELPAFARFCAGLTVDDGTRMVLEPFQRRLLADYFAGARETLVILPKKNGKTTLLAALALWHLNVEHDAECVIGATSRDQAGIMFDQATAFVRRAPGLQERLLVRRGYREIRHRRNSGRVRVLAADVDTADGIIPTLALMDELHRQASAGLYGIFRDGLGPRGGQMLAISVAGEHELSPLGQMRAAARKLPTVKQRGRYVYARSEDGGFAMHEWALEPGDDVDDMRVVKRVNPASWQPEEELRRRHDSPSMQDWQWQRFACGLWVSSEEFWMDPEQWHARATDERLEPGDRIALGFDGSRVADATALVACRLGDGLVQPLAIFEAPRDPETGQPDPEWEVPRELVDAAIAEAMELYDVVRGYFDPPLWQTEIDGWARDYGEEAVMRFSTNRARMQSATERFRTDVSGGEFGHVGDEQLTAHVLNARVRQARNGYWLAKSRPSSPEKIDAAVAAVLAYEARADALAGRGEERSRELLTF